MKIELSKPFAANSAVDEFDVRQIKKALNRLGYYQPYEKVGITEIPDSAVFEALKAFQKDHGLPATGTAKQEDETINTLNREMANAPDGLYIWRTVEDTKVRGAHAALNRTIRNWDNAPDPGDDFNCRCWAEPVEAKKIPVIDEGSQRIQSILNDTPAIFTVQEDTKADPESPWYEDVSTAEEAFAKYDIFITKAAQKHKIDPDLVRAIMWAENTRGGYIGVGYMLDDIKVSRTIMPMNIYRDIWFSLISQDKTDLYNPEKNIEAGTILLKRIQARIINPTPEKIAAVWEYIGAEKTGNYPAYIGQVYREKPWIEK